jgi:DNA-binding IclR family transcriptional regulator
MGRGDHAQLSRNAAMTTTAKVLQVLQLFDGERKQLRVADVVEQLEVSTATAYRYMADLEVAGLIERAASSQYVLGPRIVELDRQIRENDPLIAAGSDIMKSLSERTGGTALLSRLHGRQVICVHEVRGRFGPPHLSYERGRAMPLYHGATSKIILAHLADEQRRELVRTQADELRAAGLPVSFEALSALLASWRAEKVCATAGEVDRGARGWAVAVHHGQHLLGSLSVVMDEGARADPKTISDQVLRAALRIEGRLDN